MFYMMFGPQEIKAPPPVIEPDPEPLIDDDDEENLRRLAEIEARRRGRRSLRVEPNPALNTKGGSAGLKTPTT